MTMPPQRYRLLIEYDGTNFAGWQAQPEARTVQGTLEAAAAGILQQPVRAHGAGRTDAGVHARGQVAHVDASTALDEYTLRRALNARLPEDVTVRAVERAPSDFHARYSASSRAYSYTVTLERRSIGRSYAWHVFGRLRHAAMAEAAALLAGTHDFTTFSRLPSQPQAHAFCHVFEATWTLGDGAAVFAVRANRFLPGMVRALVGGLVEVGRGRIAAPDLAGLLERRDRAAAPMLVPAHGLVLERVEYEAGDFALVRRILDDLRARGAIPPIENHSCTEP
jgi:tRNA pseudouridine38-40 synthase